MLGLNIVYKCPYCNKIIFSDTGVTHYYKYNDKNVIIRSHCDKKFITEQIADNTNYGRYNIPKFKLYILACVEEGISNTFDSKLNEDEQINKIIGFIKTSESCKQYRQYVDRDINDIKVVCQLRLANLIPDFFSLPLTDEIKSKLVPSMTICW